MQEVKSFITTTDFSVDLGSSFCFYFSSINLRSVILGSGVD